MEHVVTVFIWAAVAAGFLGGLLFTEARIVPAIGGALVFGAAAILVVALGSLAAAITGRLLGTSRRRSR